MRWRQVIFLYAVVAVLGAEYWVFERRAPPAAETLPARPRLVPVAPGAVREVRVSRGGRTVVSRREAAGWAVVEPSDAPIPADLVAAFANALADAEEIATIDRADADPRSYGLDDRAARVEVTSETGEHVLLTIGDANPTGTAVYARRPGTSEVVLIGRNIRYYEDLIFQALSPQRAPATEGDAPIAG